VAPAPVREEAGGVGVEPPVAGVLVAVEVPPQAASNSAAIMGRATQIRFILAMLPPSNRAICGASERGRIHLRC
jgi:hypothetical protein